MQRLEILTARVRASQSRLFVAPACSRPRGSAYILINSLCIRMKQVEFLGFDSFGRV